MYLYAKRNTALKVPTPLRAIAIFGVFSLKTILGDVNPPA